MQCEAGQGFGTPRHIHEHEDEAFYILDGQLLVLCGPQQWHASPGSVVFLSRGIEHVLLVTGDRPFRGLQITNPAGFEDFISEVGRRPTTRRRRASSSPWTGLCGC
jgi:quercetin dioxygenase-like cupin family protein